MCHVCCHIALWDNSTSPPPPLKSTPPPGGKETVTWPKKYRKYEAPRSPNKITSKRGC